MSSEDTRSLPAVNTAIMQVDPVMGNMPEQGEAENPLTLVKNRLHGRMIPMVVLGSLFSVLFAWVGYRMAPVKYSSSSTIVIESSLPPLVEETIETADIGQFFAYVNAKAQQFRDMTVFLEAFEDPSLLSFEADRPDFRSDIFEGVQIKSPPRTSLIIVAMEDENPVFAAKAVNALVKAYERIYAPDPLAQHQDRLEAIGSMTDSVRSKLSQLRIAKSGAYSDLSLGLSDLESGIDLNVESIRETDLLIADLDEKRSRIREQVGLAARLKAEAEGREVTPEELEPRASSNLNPTLADLAEIDSILPSLEAAVATSRIALEVNAKRFGPDHLDHRRAKMDFDSKQATYEGRLEAASAEWDREMSSRSTYGSILERRKSLEDERQTLVEQNRRLERIRLELADYDLKIAVESEELGKLEERQRDLERERDTVSEGRIRFPPTNAVPAFSPSSDKRIQAALGGFAGGWMLSAGIFFLIGTIDRRTFGVEQLREGENRYLVLGVMPNMDEASEDEAMVMIASDCVHRIRGRIESRRAPETGYVLMVSSPFQGDGKTTLAVSLGWSYAESGYKVLLVDADFVGRSMTHQFGRLRDPGLREIIRSGSVDQEVVPLGHPNLNLLGVGIDRRVSAANLSPRIFSRVLDAVRGDYDIIVVDTGPITASIEALPIASSVDGAILTLRRGRSRSRLAECHKDLKSVGTDYLGVVLNYAGRSDCEHYGSTSKMSEQVADEIGATEGIESAAKRNPMLEGIQSKMDSP
ncbi:MAG: AAA family ATPase [Phycisphaerales bacterium]|nr:AAA family ATPase [Phycisphaerales bacterium]